MKPFDFQPTFLLATVNDKFYSVPRYQRSYSWTEEMVVDFWMDMEKAIADQREHFLGNIVLSAESGDGTLSIVDGQQRIVTTTILLAALRDELEAAGEVRSSDAIGRYIAQHDVKSYKDLARVRMNPDDNPFYHARFVEKTTIEPTRESHSLMNGAYEYFRDHLKSIRTDGPSSWKERFATYTRFLDEQARVVVVLAPTDADAFTVFETLNDRGADLTISDLLKNLLFARSKKEIDTVQQAWIEARTIVEELAPRTTMMTFLRHYWSSRHGLTRERELYRAIKESIKTPADAVNFAKSLKKDAIIYRAILNPNDDYWKSYSQSSKLALATSDRFGLEQLRPMLLAIYQHFAPKEAEKTTKFVVNWSVRGLVGGIMGGGKAETYFCNAATEIRNGNVKNVVELLARLKELIPNDPLFRSGFERYRTTNNNFARYLLHSLERKMQNEAEPELVPNQNAEEVNLEHVLPQKAKIADWPNFSSEMVPVYAHRIGNMTLLPKGPNDKIGNKAFAVKKPIFSSSVLKINSVFKQLTVWGQKDIEDRQISLADLAPSVWPLS